jgi:hypothetical protein
MPGLRTAVVPYREASAEVQAFLEDSPESFAQQTPGWARVVEAVGPDRSSVVLCRDGARLLGILPAHLAPGPLGSILVSAAQAGALGGVALAGGVEPEPVTAALLAGFTAFARAQGAALATVYTNPIWPDSERIERLLAPEYVLENACQVLDLERGVAADGSFPLASENLRRNLRRAEGARLIVEREATEASVREWYALHAERHGEIGARALPEALFRTALAELVPAGKASFFFVRLAGEPRTMVAGGFYVHHGQVIDALMPAWRSEFAALAPNHLLAAHSLRWARSQGYRHYNWQGSPPEGGVRRFKLQWGSADRSYRLCTRVTGDATRFLAAKPAEIRRGYPWHFALPFDVLGAAPGAGPHRTRRETAWKAAEKDEPA